LKVPIYKFQINTIHHTSQLVTKHQIFLAIGSNIVPRKDTIIRSLVAIRQAFPEGFKVSSIYLTDPFMQVPQPAYYNCCVSFSAGCSPQDLLSFCGSLEFMLGRTRGHHKWQSRPIDIDILLFGGTITKELGLIIPHYDLENRDFFLTPMLEIEKDLVHPVSNEPLGKLLDRIPNTKRTHPQRILKPEIQIF
jgi:2-amino-4-hydroxy-6-hydroxymethyldihydropteridine diphosphokinase